MRQLLNEGINHRSDLSSRFFGCDGYAGRILNLIVGHSVRGVYWQTLTSICIFCLSIYSSFHMWGEKYLRFNVSIDKSTQISFFELTMEMEYNYNQSNSVKDEIIAEDDGKFPWLRQIALTAGRWVRKVWCDYFSYWVSNNSHSMVIWSLKSGTTQTCGWLLVFTPKYLHQVKTIIALHFHEMTCAHLTAL